MKVLILLVSLIFLSVSCQEEGQAEKGDLSGGWGTHIRWIPPSQLHEKGENERPFMIILHDPNCPACKRFKPLFAGNSDIPILSREFQMIQVSSKEQDEHLSDFKASLSPDGAYIPRIIFLAPNKTLLQDIFNHNANPNYKYFYYDPHDVIISMKKVINLFPKSVKSEL